MIIDMDVHCVCVTTHSIGNDDDKHQGDLRGEIRLKNTNVARNKWILITKDRVDLMTTWTNEFSKNKTKPKSKPTKCSLAHWV